MLPSLPVSVREVVVVSSAGAGRPVSVSGRLETARFVPQSGSYGLVSSRVVSAEGECDSSTDGADDAGQTVTDPPAPPTDRAAYMHRSSAGAGAAALRPIGCRGPSLETEIVCRSGSRP